MCDFQGHPQALPPLAEDEYVLDSPLRRVVADVRNRFVADVRERVVADVRERVEQAGSPIAPAS